MLPSQRRAFGLALYDVLVTLAAQQSAPLLLSADDLIDSLHQPKQAEHGDLATSIVLKLAKSWCSKPPALAQAWANSLMQSAALREWLVAAEVAGPGFVNFRLQPAAKTAVVKEILERPDHFGHQPLRPDDRVLLEFVSANPTGPLHVGHGRQAALGDSLAKLLESQGALVHREFYYNDAGAQIENLARSVGARVNGLTPDDPAFPVDGYRGDYIEDIALAYRRRESVTTSEGTTVVAEGDPNNLLAIGAFAVAYLRHEQDLDLAAFGVCFDQFSLESALYTDGHVESVVQRLVKNGKAYESDGALWLRSTDYGDDKDRVMRKSDGGYTYFVPDVAYHLQKWTRGFGRAVNIQGSDHHGTIARVRAGLQALEQGVSEGFPSYILHKMVTVMRNGQEVKISKRAGAYVTLRDLIIWSGSEAGSEAGTETDSEAADIERGRDAVRFFLVSRKADSEFVFDVDLALSKSDENPVYYVQYAHARIQSVLMQAGHNGADLSWTTSLTPAERAACLERLDSPKALALCSSLATYPGILAQAAEEFAPHLIAFYLRDLAAAFHGFYNADRVLVDDPVLRQARLLLLVATACVLKSGLSILGVRAPNKM